MKRKNDPVKIQLTPVEFRAIILSHGYFWLAPVIGTETPPSIVIPYNLPGRKKGCIRISVSSSDVVLEVLSGQGEYAIEVASGCLSLEEDIRPLRRIARTDDTWEWIIKEKKGRFLRSPSLFEDCCKAIFTVNIQWKRSVQMADAAVQKFGALTGARFEKKPVRAFPSPEKLSRLSAEELRKELNCGFRSRFILSLCDTAMEKPGIYLGDGWRGMSSEEFCEEIGSVSGMGPMSVAYVSRLYGKTNTYHMDSWVVRRCVKLWGLNEDEVEKHVRRRYGEFGSYGPAVFWFELTRYWHYSDEEIEELRL